MARYRVKGNEGGFVVLPGIGRRRAGAVVHGNWGHFVPLFLELLPPIVEAVKEVIAGEETPREAAKQAMVGLAEELLQAQAGRAAAVPEATEVADPETTKAKTKKAWRGGGR